MPHELVLMPERLDLLIHVPLESIDDILIVAGARKSNYTPTHG